LDGALYNFELAAELNPGDAVARNNACATLAALREDAPGAIRHCTASAEITARGVEAEAAARGANAQAAAAAAGRGPAPESPPSSELFARSQQALSTLGFLLLAHGTPAENAAALGLYQHAYTATVVAGTGAPTDQQVKSALCCCQRASVRARKCARVPACAAAHARPPVRRA
jgi:hypothetical protein